MVPFKFATSVGVIVKVVRNVPTKKELPPRAQRWLDVRRAQMRKRALADPALRSAQENLDRLTVELSLPLYFVKVFRDLHFIAYPDTSVAALEISDDEFLDLLWDNIYTIDILENRLASGKITSLVLRRALEKWKSARSTAE